MIDLTKINGDPMVINAELIEQINKTPDTIITLTNGKKIIVRDSMESIIDKVVEYKRKIHSTKIKVG